MIEYGLPHRVDGRTETPRGLVDGLVSGVSSVRDPKTRLWIFFMTTTTVSTVITLENATRIATALTALALLSGIKAPAVAFGGATTSSPCCTFI